MRILTSLAVLAGVFGPLATAALAADLDDYPPPPPYYERGPVPPAFVPERVRPVVVRPVLYPRVVRPYGFYGPRPVVRVYGEPRVYGEVYGRPLPPRVYGEPGYERDRTIVRREDFGREGYGHEGYGRQGYADGYGRDGRGYEHEPVRREREGGYGHYLSHEELDRRVEREHGRERFADRDGHDDRFAERGRDFDR